MNDPGLDAPIQDAEEEVMGRRTRGEWEREAAEEDLLLDPSRWWFASTASPLIAGTFGPMASAFNICALVQHWREYIPSAKTEETGTSIPDPTWLLAINAVSLVFAVIGNATLLLNMVDRLPFKYAQPITITGFFVAGFLLIALVAVASSDILQLEPRGDHALTQPFYYACYAAGLYTIIGMLMTFTVYGALAGKYPKKFEINNSQRTLMLQTMSFMAYLLVGAAIYCRVENWQFTDAVFWANFTLLTIGLGLPFVPVTHLGRSLLFPFTFGGILAIGLVIGSIRSMLLEKGAQKMHARTTEKKRQRILELKDSEVGKTRWNWLYHKKRPSQRAFKHELPERDRRREEFHAMRRIQEHSARRNRYVSLATSAFNTAILWFLGALVFWYAEYKQSWSYFECVYFCYTSLTTIGYGDFEPQSNSGKSFFVLYTLLAVPTLTVLISDMGDTVVKGVAEATNWIGSLTVAPGDKEFWAKLRNNIRYLTRGAFFKHARLPHKKSEELKLMKKADEGRLGEFPELLYSRLTEKERAAIDEFHEHGEETEHERDILFYHFLLVKEVRNVLADAHSAVTKTYTYDEWAYFLKLIGQDETNRDYHALKYNQPKKDDENAPQVGRILDHKGEAREWSWLSLRSPLLSQMTEPEWLLQRLLEKLHGAMHFQRKKMGSGKDRPPVSVQMVRSRSRRGSPEGGGVAGSGVSGEGTVRGDDEEQEKQEDSEDREPSPRGEKDAGSGGTGDEAVEEADKEEEEEEHNETKDGRLQKWEWGGFFDKEGRKGREESSGLGS